MLHVRWWRVVGIHAYLDTQKAAEACQRLARQGVNEAAATPIEF